MQQTLIPIRIRGFVTVYAVKGKNGVVLVDTGTPGASDIIIRGLRKHGIEADDVKLILITHGHSDHFGSARALRVRLEAPVAVHQGDAAALRSGVNAPETLKPVGRLMTFLNRLPVEAAGKAPQLTPDLVFEDGWRLDEYGVAAEVIPTPGHTPGSVAVWLEGGDALVGDMVCRRLPRLRDLPGPPYVAWDLEQNRESLAVLLARKPHLLYSAHGGPYTAETIASLV
ncbi:MAG: MBL fold metallo-hydrolase [Anaerolineae bacterium]|nr:MBL fold metallo-hydrolase [Anaerolineae bacterium]